MGLFDLFKNKNKTSANGQLSPDEDESQKYYTKDEILNFITKYGNSADEIKKVQLLTEKQDAILKAHRCSIHGTPIEYAFDIEGNGKKTEGGIVGTKVSLVILNKCCSQSSDELVAKFKN